MMHHHQSLVNSLSSSLPPTQSSCSNQGKYKSCSDKSTCSSILSVPQAAMQVGGYMLKNCSASQWKNQSIRVNTRTIQLPLKRLKGIGIGMTLLSDWLNVLPRGRCTAGVTELPLPPKGMLWHVVLNSCACNIVQLSRAAFGQACRPAT